MDNLITLLTVALICAAFGFVAGSMLTSIWIDRHSKDTQSNSKKLAKGEKEFARIILDQKGETLELEIDGDIYSPSHKPDPKMVNKLKPMADLLMQWMQKNEKPEEKMENTGKEEKSAVSKGSDKEETEKITDRDMLFEINNIIQEKLKVSSSVVKKIRLAREGATGVSFWIDEQSFKTLESIPDDQVRKLIKGAVADWESQVN